MAEKKNKSSWDMLGQGLVTERRLDEALSYQRNHPGTSLPDALDKTETGSGILLGGAGELFSGTTIVEGKEDRNLESEDPWREWKPEDIYRHEPCTRFRKRTGSVQCFGKYYLGNLIGKGGSGAVYSAFQRDLGREVALKFPSGGDPASLQQFFSEGHLAAKLNHPNIVRVFEMGQHEGVVFLSMEVIRGHSMDRLDLHPGQAVRAIRDAARAMSHAHRAGILHQDLKPQNIMMDRKGKVTLIDFGLARELDSKEAPFSPEFVRGTPAYMSPEQVRGEQGGPWSDVYSLGATLYRSVAKCAPFEGGSLKEVLEKVENEVPAPLRTLQPGIPKSLDRIVAKAMAKKPGLRYATTKALASDLNRILKPRSSRKRAG